MYRRISMAAARLDEIGDPVQICNEPLGQHGRVLLGNGQADPSQCSAPGVKPDAAGLESCGADVGGVDHV